MKIILLSHNNNVDIIFSLDKIGNLVCFELGSGQRRSINIVNLKGKVCAIDRFGKAYLINGCESSMMSTVISWPIPTGYNEGSERHKLLVESFGELYLIHRPYGDYFQVYNLDFEEKVWNKVDSFRDRILLVTFDNCFFVDSESLPGFGGNYIMFPKNRFPTYHSGWCYPDDLVFLKANKYLEIAVVYLHEGVFPGRVISSYPGLSDFFWPPPSWAKPGFPSFARILSGLYEKVKERAPRKLRYVSYLFA
ncbi:uncharacterized protein [Spinacia oleracea]|uniref:KIB1-4 beta-propeller domain-containing protein n=1 Tax=Spinacia oleracea TaxID=3562 RepID=A0A9R0JH27_SPIOL|nr:uncharacterized protein LOC110805049 [Spinacia oleracea]